MSYLSKYSGAEIDAAVKKIQELPEGGTGGGGGNELTDIEKDMLGYIEEQMIPEHEELVAACRPDMMEWLWEFSQKPWLKVPGLPVDMADIFAMSWDAGKGKDSKTFIDVFEGGDPMSQYEMDIQTDIPGEILGNIPKINYELYGQKLEFNYVGTILDPNSPEMKKRFYMTYCANSPEAMGMGPGVRMILAIIQKEGSNYIKMQMGGMMDDFTNSLNRVTGCNEGVPEPMEAWPY